MSQNSTIEWTEATWNPVRGCTKVSPGCANCYAETFAERWRGVKGHAYEQGFDLRLVPDKLDEPLRRKKPTTYFVNSMSDLFQEGVPDAFIDRVFAVMALAPQHTFQVLTKRADRMRLYASDTALGCPGTDVCTRIAQAADGLGLEVTPRSIRARWPLPNVWLIVSVENQRFADERIPQLLQTPAAVRGISAEPLLEGIDISKFLTAGDSANPTRALNTHGQTGSEANSADTLGPASRKAVAKNVGAIRQEAERPAAKKLDWVIVGGESGSGARPFHIKWARSIVDQCKAAGVPVFVKQLGTNPHANVAATVAVSRPLIPMVLRDRKGGDPAEWPEDLRVREMPSR